MNLRVVVYSVITLVAGVSKTDIFRNHGFPPNPVVVLKFVLGQ